MDKLGTEEVFTAILVRNMGHGVTARSWTNYRAFSKPFSYHGWVIHPCNQEGPQPQGCHRCEGEFGGTQPCGIRARQGLVRSVSTCGWRKANAKRFGKPQNFWAAPGRKGRAVLMSHNVVLSAGASVPTSICIFCTVLCGLPPPCRARHGRGHPPWADITI